MIPRPPKVTNPSAGWVSQLPVVLESVSCEDDQTTGERHPCVCPDPLCACKTRPMAHHHIWHRQRLNKIDGLLTLTGLLKRQKTANEKGPTP